MKPNKIVSIALTGGIGSGKSLACQILLELGLPNISADTLGHQVLQHPKIIRKLSNIFGKEIIANNTIDRQILGNNAFKMENGSQILNDIMHPPIVELLKKKIKEQKVTTIYEIPLLFEAKLQHLFDATLLITANYNIRINRILERKGMNLQKAKQILKSQMPETEKMQLADHVILNNGTEMELKKKLTDFMIQVTGNHRS